MHLTFIRHTAVKVLPGTCYGASDVPLADSFESEATTVALKMKGRKFDAVFSSPLSRCRRLATFCGYSSPIVDDRLKEMNFGSWEMKRFDDITDPRLQEWYDNYLDTVPTGGESFRDVGRRVNEFLDEVEKHNYGNVLIFAHGGVILHAMLRYKMTTIEQSFNDQPKYGQAVEITI